MNNLPEPSEECLAEILIKIYKKASKDRKDIFDKYSEELAEISKTSSYEIMKNVVESMDFLNSILSPSEFQEELKKCFKS